MILTLSYTYIKNKIIVEFQTGTKCGRRQEKSIDFWKKNTEIKPKFFFSCNFFYYLKEFLIVNVSLIIFIYLKDKLKSKLFCAFIYDNFLYNKFQNLKLKFYILKLFTS